MQLDDFGRDMITPFESAGLQPAMPSGQDAAVTLDMRVESLVDELIGWIKEGVASVDVRCHLTEQNEALFRRRYSLSVRRALAGRPERPTDVERMALANVARAHGRIAGAIATFRQPNPAKPAPIDNVVFLKAAHVMEVESEAMLTRRLAREREVAEEAITEEEKLRFIFCI